ncbi:MAG: HD domain-containing protein [Bacteroidetes bacterium]|nr:HD domain-containing protein [Bacteroidota bacterium]
MNDILIETATAFVEKHFQENIPPSYLYHNFNHVQDVLSAAKRIVSVECPSDEEQEALLLSALFHDTGFSAGAKDHEERSVQIFRQFAANSVGITDQAIEKVVRLILSTKSSHQPTDWLEGAMSDADFGHLGNENYWDRSNRLRQEWLLTENQFQPEIQFVQAELNFMVAHKYNTPSARILFDEGKEKNIKFLLKYKNTISPSEEGKDKKKNNKSREPEVSRGVETMFRATYRTHINLSAIADNKANIMLSISAIIISIVLSNLLPQLKMNPRLAFPTFLLLAVCLISLVFAILSTRPKVTSGTVTDEDIKDRKANLLFFGNFYNMEMEKFQEGMMEMIQDNDFLYNSMTRDLYFLGKVLAVKYKYLRICYAVFMYGIIIALSAFGYIYITG